MSGVWWTQREEGQFGLDTCDLVGRPVRSRLYLRSIQGPKEIEIHQATKSGHSHSIYMMKLDDLYHWTNNSCPTFTDIDYFMTLGQNSFLKFLCGLRWNSGREINKIYKIISVLDYKLHKAVGTFQFDSFIFLSI